jgi:hypothetical protein
VALFLIRNKRTVTLFSILFFYFLLPVPVAARLEPSNIGSGVYCFTIMLPATTPNDKQSSLFFHNINYDEKNKMQLLFDHWLNENECNTKNILKNKILKQNVFCAIGFYNEADTLEYTSILVYSHFGQEYLYRVRLA